MGRAEDVYTGCYVLKYLTMGVADMIQIACGFSSYIDSVSSLYMSIGRTCSRYQDFGLLYPDSTGLQKAQCEYFTIVVELCKRTVLFTRRGAFSQLSWSVRKPFATEFGHFEADLARLAGFVRDEISLASSRAHANEVQENSRIRKLTTMYSDKVGRELQQAKKRRSDKAKRLLLEACSTYNYEMAWKQNCKKGKSQWLFECEEYIQWKRMATSSILWCSGILGSGKTVLSANVVENLVLTEPTATVAYFFCEYDVPQSLLARTII